jgi:hypothetical protein
MSINSEVFLREEQNMEINVQELGSGTLVLVLTIKEGYRTVGSMRIFGETAEQDLLLRMLGEAYEKSKNCIPLELV